MYLKILPKEGTRGFYFLSARLDSHLQDKILVYQIIWSITHQSRCQNEHKKNTASVVMEYFRNQANPNKPKRMTKTIQRCNKIRKITWENILMIPVHPSKRAILFLQINFVFSFCSQPCSKSHCTSCTKYELQRERKQKI